MVQLSHLPCLNRRVWNLALVCPFHHGMVHHHGWTIRMGPDRRPEFIPPAYLDPDQKPRRNLLHKTHPDLLDGIVPSQRNPRHVAPRNPAYPTSGDTPPAANAG